MKPSELTAWTASALLGLMLLIALTMQAEPKKVKDTVGALLVVATLLAGITFLSAVMVWVL